MDFARYCESQLMDALTDADVKVFQGELLFRLDHIRKLGELRNLEYVDDLVIDVYYVHSGRRMEVQDLSLSVRVAESVQLKDAYFLSVTEKQSMDQIDGKLLELLDNTYYEIQRGDTQAFTECIQRYAQYISENGAKLLSEHSGVDSSIDGEFFFRLF